MKIKIDVHNCGFFTYRRYTSSTNWHILPSKTFERIYVSQTINIIKQIGL